MNNETVYIVTDGGKRMDVFLSEVMDKTRSYIKQLNDSGAILVNGNAEKCGRVVKPGDEISVTETERDDIAEPEDIPIDVIYEDSDIAVINKRQGMSVHPGAGVHGGTLANALMHRFNNLSGVGGKVRPGIVHRLDKDTSGIIAVAKNDKAHLALSEQLGRREVQKIYLALLEGNLKCDSGEVRTFIGRSPRDRKKMAVVDSGKEAVTFYKVTERFKDNCLVEFDIKTGRTHQIRVHAKYLGHPVVGDKTYGYTKQKFRLDGQLLHAMRITFKHPSTGKNMTFTAPIPEYFEKVLDTLRKQREE